MISFRELIGNTPVSDIPIAHQHNLEELLIRVNVVRAAWARPMLVTSGYRSMHSHLRIYSEINSKRKIEGKPELHIPMSSKHLSGNAVDISDPDGSLYNWCQHNIPLLEKTGLWCEIKDDQARVHFQINPPASGNRFFKP